MNRFNDGKGANHASKIFKDYNGALHIKKIYLKKQMGHKERENHSIFPYCHMCTSK
jgi:hypothetical protein